MNTILEFLEKDFTDVYEHIGGSKEWLGNYSNTLDGLPTTLALEKGKYYYSSPYLSFGDYDNSSHIERSNLRVFIEMFGSCEDVLHVKGGMGSECIFVDVTCTNKEIIDLLCSLEDYPAIDEEDCELMKSELEIKSWDSWIYSDFLECISKHLGYYDIECEDNKALFEFYKDKCEELGIYYEIEAGGVGWIKVEDLMEGISIQNLPNFIKVSNEMD